jgi:tetratricopeptide (TPR) repeat protein
MADTTVQRDFFISFNGADLAYAEAIDAALRAEGFTTYFHPRDLGPGGNVPLWMDQALLNSTQTLALFSPDYIKDKAVYSLAERYATWWQDARGDERKLIPILLHEIEFTPLMGMLSRIEVKGLPLKDAATHVVKRLNGKDETKKRDEAQIGSGLPRVFSVAYRPNPNFTGRFEALDALQKSLRAGNAAITAVAGMGGVGKTTLAAEYCHRFGGRYGGVWWIKAEQESVMLADLQALGVRLKIVSGENIETDARATLEHLASLTEPWLLVYDNASNADAVRKWLPVGAVRCIITSRRGDFDDLAKVTPLDQWSDQVTAEYLLARTGRDDAAGAERLAQALGGLPLAAEQAAAFLKFRKGISYDDYAKEIGRLIKENKPAGDYPDTVYAAFVKSLDALGETEAGKIGLDILRLCAFLSPDGVDLWLLTVERDNQVLPASFAAAMADKFKREDALAVLGQLSLLRQEDGPMGPVLFFHRLLLEVVRNWVGQDARSLWSQVAAWLVGSAFPNKPDEPAGWVLCARLMPHLAMLESYASNNTSSREALDWLLNQACLYLTSRGDRVGALAAAERTVDLMRVTRLNDPLVLAVGLNNLAMQYLGFGRLDEAERTYKETLEIQETRLDASDTRFGSTLSNLANLHRLRKHFDKSEALLLRVAIIKEVAHGAQSSEYGTSLSNLGLLYAQWWEATGDGSRLSQAENYVGKAFNVTVGASGVRHPSTATRYNLLAGLNSRLLDWPKAASRAERILAIMLSLDLTKHSETPHRAGELAYLWQQSDQSDKAMRLRNGDISDLLPVIAQIETEHRAWVAENPDKRNFGPPSFFEPKSEEQVEQVLSAFATAGGDMNGLKRRLQSRELSKDDFARIVAEQIARKAG